MKGIKTEIYQCKFNKYTTPNGDVGYSVYTIGIGYDVADMKITPVKIVVIKDRVYVYFSDGGKHIFGVNNDTEFFYRPVQVKKEEVEDHEGEEDGTTA
jgi:hypothetical protein